MSELQDSLNCVMHALSILPWIASKIHWICVTFVRRQSYHHLLERFIESASNAENKHIQSISNARSLSMISFSAQQNWTGNAWARWHVLGDPHLLHSHRNGHSSSLQQGSKAMLYILATSWSLTWTRKCVHQSNILACCDHQDKLEDIQIILANGQFGFVNGIFCIVQNYAASLPSSEFPRHPWCVCELNSVRDNLGFLTFKIIDLLKENAWCLDWPARN